LSNSLLTSERKKRGEALKKASPLLKNVTGKELIDLVVLQEQALPVFPEIPVLPVFPEIPVLPVFPEIPVLPVFPEIPVLPVFPALPPVPPVLVPAQAPAGNQQQVPEKEPLPLKAV
jgi:hypothetical protein